MVSKFFSHKASVFVRSEGHAEENLREWRRRKINDAEVRVFLQETRPPSSELI